jgi:hypothetical protein
MKILITAPTFVPSIDGPAFLDTNTIADMETDSARAVVAAGKGLYVDRKDDNTKLGQHTAPESLLKLLADAAAAATKAAKAGAQ